MSSWQDELDQILSKLNVQQEGHTQPEPTSSTEAAEFSLTQASHDHPGVFYRLDLTDTAPELRIYIPTNEGAYKMHIYLVKLAPYSFLAHTFGLFLAYNGGSPSFREVEGSIIYHLMLLMLNAMKELFWQGDLATFRFPPEIEVRHLL
jgi:hypothetical protein